MDRRRWQSRGRRGQSLMRTLQPDHLRPALISIPGGHSPLCTSAPPLLTDYHPDLMGMTGCPGQVETLTKAYKVFFSKPTDQDVQSGDYIVDHSIATFMFDPQVTSLPGPSAPPPPPPLPESWMSESLSTYDSMSSVVGSNSAAVSSPPGARGIRAVPTCAILGRWGIHFHTVHSMQWDETATPWGRFRTARAQRQ